MITPVGKKLTHGFRLLIGVISASLLTLGVAVSQAGEGKSSARSSDVVGNVAERASALRQIAQIATTAPSEQRAALRDLVVTRSEIIDATERARQCTRRGLQSAVDDSGLPMEVATGPITESADGFVVGFSWTVRAPDGGLAVDALPPDANERAAAIEGKCRDRFVTSIGLARRLYLQSDARAVANSVAKVRQCVSSAGLDTRDGSPRGIQDALLAELAKTSGMNVDAVDCALEFPLAFASLES
jgi:hypothetical protein